MANSPRTPAHSRHPSALSISISPAAPSHSRRQSTTSHRSRASVSSQTPTTPDSHNPDTLFSSGGAANGLGNLADELADAWASDEDGEGDEEPDMNFASAADEPAGADLPGQRAGQQDDDSDEERGRHAQKPRDSGVSVSGSPQRSPTKTLTALSRHRKAGSDYDGSDYGSASSLDETGLPPSLVARIDAVESLARRGLEDNGSARSAVIGRVVDSLRALSGQGGVEAGATRLITAHAALSSHLVHQTRLLHSLTHPLFTPGSAPLDAAAIDELLPLVLGLGEAMPRPEGGALAALTGLHSLTQELVEGLGGVADTLHMSRQTTGVAQRRLRAARELVEELRREEEAREEGERWLRRGNWGERLGRRECARVCGDVVGGFEEVCEGWRRRLGEGEAVGA